jgi:hypothetical protein
VTRLDKKSIKFGTWNIWNIGYIWWIKIYRRVFTN